MAGSRAEILGKIRLALTKPRPEHHHGHETVTSDLKELFASVWSRDALVEKFQKEFRAVGGEFTDCSSEATAIAALKELIVTSSFSRVAVSAHAICSWLKVMERLQAELPGVHFLAETIDSESPFERSRLKKALAEVQLSITGCEYLLAESGTIVNTAGSQASRQITLLPTLHVVLATPDQIYPNMADLFLGIQKKHGTTLPGSTLTFITGPSRTADIEKVLIRGVHGPMRLAVLMLSA
jgi:L-lactate dehydrogenase complex protein LldG